MRIIVQGAGAIGQAAAALLIDRHEVAVASRVPRARAVFPERVPTIASRFVADTARVRRVPVIDWAEAARHDWDLVLLMTRPGDLDAEVTDAVRAISPRWLLSTSQVTGDLETAQDMFSTQVLIAGPSFLSERIDDEAARTMGRDVRYWLPPATPAFLVAGDEPRAQVRGRSSWTPRGGLDSRAHLHRELGPLALPVPLPVVLDLPRVFIPFAAELSVRGGDWSQLLGHLERPARASAEAIVGLLARTSPGWVGPGCCPPALPTAARIVLHALDTLSPISMRDYAGRHFGRHLEQSRDMLAGWTHEVEAIGITAEALCELSEALTKAIEVRADGAHTGDAAASR